MRAADSARAAWSAWRQVAHAWDIFTTGRDLRLSPVGTEIRDLVLWVGRLAHRDPGWTPTRDRSRVPRGIASPADEPEALSTVIAAVHQASDALAHIAVLDRDTVGFAAIHGHVYVPTRLLPEEFDVPFRYAPALASHVDELRGTYDAAVAASTEAVTALDKLAVSTNSPSATLATLRAAGRMAVPQLVRTGPTPTNPPIGQPPPGLVERAVRDLGIGEPALLARASSIDDATCDLLREVAAKSGRQTAASLSSPSTPGLSPAKPRHPARVSAKDSPHHPLSGPPASFPAPITTVSATRSSPVAGRRHPPQTG